MSQKCDRCGSPTYVTTMSYFNTDIICDECEGLEKLHSGYHEAKEAENDQVLRGNYNFEGVGLPTGYREWARAKKAEVASAPLDDDDIEQEGDGVPGKEIKEIIEEMLVALEDE